MGFKVTSLTPAVTPIGKTGAVSTVELLVQPLQKQTYLHLLDPLYIFKVFFAGLLELEVFSKKEATTQDDR